MKISCCMVVHCPDKEMEGLFKRTLRSLRGHIDELNVVATKQDATQEIALAWAENNPGVSVHTIYEPWAKDFSLHRNTSLSMVGDDIDWILVMDSDEELIVTFDLRAWLKSLKPTDYGVAFKLHDNRQGVDKMETTQPRLFRRGHIKYSQAVHNQPIITGDIAVLCPFADVRHYGYGLSQVLMNAKWDRTEEMLVAALEKDPAFKQAHFYLMQVAGMRGHYEAVIKHGEEYISHRASEGELFLGAVYYSVARAQQQSGDIDGMGRTLLAGLREYPDDADLNMAMSDYGTLRNDPGLVGKGCAIFCKAYKQWIENPASVGNKFQYTLLPEYYALARYRLAMVHLRNWFDNWNELKAIINETPDDLRRQMKEEASLNYGSMGIDMPIDWISPSRLVMVK